MNVLVQTTVARLKRHPAHQAAKAGDPQAASRIVQDLFRPATVRPLVACYASAIVVAVHAEERAGRNMLPIALAVAIGKLRGNPVDRDIVQSNRVFHTGASALHRLLAVPEFDGPVSPGQTYIVVDDVVTSGSSLQGLRRFIERGGGLVVGAVAMAASSNPQTGYGGWLDAHPATLTLIEGKFDMAALTGVLVGHGIIKETLRELTNSQARYLACYKSADSVRDSLAAAQ